MDYNKQLKFSKACARNELKKLNKMDLSDIDVNYSFSDALEGPIFLASQQGNIEIVKFLIQKGADISLENNNSVTPVMVAYQNNHNDIVDLLTHNGVYLDIALLKNLEFLLACKSGNLESTIIVSQKNIDFQNKFGRTAISYAAQSNKIELLELLLQKGANLNIQDVYGKSPLEYACNRNGLIFFNINQNGSMEVIDDNVLECVKLLVKNGSELNSKNINGQTPLIISSSKSRPDVVECLLENGANVHSQDNEGITPLLAAAGYGAADTVEFLIKYNSDLNVQNDHGETALMKAAMFSHVDVVEILLTHGADQDIKNNENKTAFDLSSDIAILLLLNKDINKQDENGNTLLMIACQDKNENHVIFLYENGADFYMKNNDDLSAYDILKRKRALPPALQALKENIILNNDIDHYNGLNYGL